MQPFLSGEATLAILLSLLTFTTLFAAGFDAPDDDYVHQTMQPSSKPSPCQPVVSKAVEDGSSGKRHSVKHLQLHLPSIRLTKHNSSIFHTHRKAHQQEVSPPTSRLGHSPPQTSRAAPPTHADFSAAKWHSGSPRQRTNVSNLPGCHRVEWSSDCPGLESTRVVSAVS